MEAICTTLSHMSNDNFVHFIAHAKTPPHEGRVTGFDSRVAESSVGIIGRGEEKGNCAGSGDGGNRKPNNRHHGGMEKGCRSVCRTYKSGMGEEGAHIRLKLDTEEPVALSEFVGEFVGIGNQFAKFIARERPELKTDSEFYIKEVRSGCIEADLVMWLAPGSLALFTATTRAIDIIDKGQILAKFVDDVGNKIGRYFRPGGRAPGVAKSDLADFLKTTKAIATDPNGSIKLEAAVYEDGKRQVKAAFKFTSSEAKQAEVEIASHRKELEATTGDNQRALLSFVRPSVEAGKPGKKGGERGIIESLNKRALPVLYASEMAEQRMLHEKMQLDGNVFRALFDVSVNVEMSSIGKALAYRITDVHAVIDGEDDGSLVPK